MKILDCFTFFNELDLLEFRLKQLDSVVDKFVICEADRTHSGISKGYILDQSWARFSKYTSKIQYIKVKLPDDYALEHTYDNNRWEYENAQRNALSGGIEPNSICLVGDIDEIPTRAAITEVISRNEYPVGFGMRACNWYFNVYDPKIPWVGTVAAPSQFVMDNKPQHLRDIRFRLPKIENAGCHWTYCTPITAIANKISAFAHDEFDTEEFKSMVRLTELRNKLADPFGRMLPDGRPLFQGQQLRLADQAVPEYLREHVSDYKTYLKEF